MVLPSETPLIPLGIRLELKEALVKRFFWFLEDGDCGEARLRRRMRGRPQADRIWPLRWDRSAATLGDGSGPGGERALLQPQGADRMS